MKSFPEATKEELEDLNKRLEEVCIQWKKDHNVSALSVAGGWNVYRGIEDAVWGYHWKLQEDN